MQIDNPRCPPDVLGWLCKQQAARLDGLRVRICAVNEASGARRPGSACGASHMQQQL